ncbi:MAG: hypothetical protein KC478_16715 [Bacteriovoracaceae bacterium]|nr:hypothetical protein [Bacteriovoracaceae bacterium]
MRKLINTILLGSTLITMNASANLDQYEDVEGYLIGGSLTTSAGIVSSLHGLAAGALSYTGGAVLLSATVLALQEYHSYEGLDQDSIEVLAGQADLEDQAALSLFKEDVLANQVEIEAAVLAESGEQIDLSTLSDADFSKLALSFASAK